METNLTIFLVEDSEQIRDLLIQSVNETGLGSVIGCAETEDEAVSEILRLRPDAVVLDIQLSVGNGLNVLKKIRTLLQDSMPAVIVYTDYAIAEFSRRADYLGARYFLDKASDLNYLRGLLRTLGERPQTSL